MEASAAHAPRARLWSLQPDTALCLAGARGSQAAFDELHRRHHRQLSAFVFHLLGGRHRHEDTEEIVQDAFARAFAGVREREFVGSFRAWLFVIARNRAFDLKRSEQARVALTDAPGAGAPRARPADEPEPAAESREDLAWLVRAIGELPERQRSALLLRELGGLSHEEIAGSLETTAGSVRQLIGRGRDGVRRAAGNDDRAPESLRRGLLDAAPLAVLGGAATGGAGLGAGGLLAAGKFAATLATVAVLAGTGAVVERQVGATENPAKAAAEAAHAAPTGSRPARGHSPDRPDQGRVEAKTRSLQTRAETEAPGSRDSEPAQAPQDGKNAADAPPGGEQADDPGEAPLGPVTDLPSKVLGNVGAGLSGEKPLPEAVGDTVADTLDTVGQTAKGLLDPLAGR